MDCLDPGLQQQILELTNILLLDPGTHGSLFLVVPCLFTKFHKGPVVPQD